MITDNKTLADAQPGGKVRLGDGLLPCPFCGNGAEFVPYKVNGLTLKCKSMGCIQRRQRTLRYGIEWLRISMTEHWNARALSAQPSLAGQGDALLREVSAQLESLDCGACIGSYAPMEDLHGRIAAHLAARQPVGAAVKDSLTVGGGREVGQEPFVWSDRAKAHALEGGQFGFTKADGQDLGYTACIEACVDAICNVLALPEHRAAPPAQAVDLERFRGTVKSQYSMTEWMHRCGFVSAEKLEDSKKNHDHLLALIDSQAVGNG